MPRLLETRDGAFLCPPPSGLPSTIKPHRQVTKCHQASCDDFTLIHIRGLARMIARSQSASVLGHRDLRNQLATRISPHSHPARHRLTCPQRHADGQAPPTIAKRFQCSIAALPLRGSPKSLGAPFHTEKATPTQKNTQSAA